MKKIIRIKNLCCANCGAKIEREIAKIDGVSEVALSFIMQKIVIQFEGEWESIFDKVVAIAKKVEPDCVLSV